MKNPTDAYEYKVNPDARLSLYERTEPRHIDAWSGLLIALSMLAMLGFALYQSSHPF